MSYSIEATAYFAKQLKRLAKKFPSLKKEYADLINSLKENPEQGNNIGNNCFKIRLAIASKQKGKSGGARLITHIQIIETKVYLLSIYDKSEQSDISDKDLDNWLKDIE
ncbi:type II toxin-antitoxin system RelE/ParE family toxin [Pedobacter frigiditerrae]|uniref:type II toxin-antitoxin system RelE/ParE family toxin n=1 Tax=Pedobacter frigiditerrae TaxID=2530452 RepID=UPI00292CFE44|nr:type II toxin-antitoxin system RelE/ParE family toxin [Pedobacter frigiditerrae]